MTRRGELPGQLGFDALLADAARDNEARKAAAETAHLPGRFEEAAPFYRGLIERHHAAMLAGDAETVMRLRREARDLAVKLNNFEPGILAGPDAPGCALESATRAANGIMPLWGQIGEFEIAAGGMRVRIEMEGMYGVASDHYDWLGFAAHAVDLDKPFLSETGYRSFLAVGGDLRPGYGPDRFAAEIIAAHVKRALKGRLCRIEPHYRDRRAATASA